MIYNIKIDYIIWSEHHNLTITCPEDVKGKIIETSALLLKLFDFKAAALKNIYIIQKIQSLI